MFWGLLDRYSDVDYKYTMELKILKFKLLGVINVFVMYYIYGISGPSLLMESTDSMRVLCMMFLNHVWQSLTVIIYKF